VLVELRQLALKRCGLAVVVGCCCLLSCRHQFGKMPLFKSHLVTRTAQDGLNACSACLCHRADIGEDQIAAAIEERAAARAAKDYAAADAVRLRLEASGILIMDTPQGTSWKPGPRLHVAQEENASGSTAQRTR
jgi:hypothetical protein